VSLALRILRLLVALGALAGCDAEPLIGEPPVTLALPLAPHTLANGLTVVVVPNHAAPLITGLLAVRAGSAVEDASNNGYSHLFEHMIFQGSQAVPSARTFRERLDALGASRNATTGIDRVSYFFTAQSLHASEALGLFAGALQQPALAAEALDKERQVVLSEFDLNESNLGFVRQRKLLQLLLGDSAPRFDPLGSRAVVQSVSAQLLQRAHATYYVPNNALLVLSGDLTVERGRELAEQHFSAWQAGADPAPDTASAPLPALADGLDEVIAAPISATEIELAWRGPSELDDPEGVLAGALLSSITYQGDHTFRQLVGADGAFSAGFNVTSTRHLGLLRVQLSIPPGAERSVLARFEQVLRALEKLGGAITEDQLEAAKDRMFRIHLFASSDPAQLPQLLADHWGKSSLDRYRAYEGALYDIDRAAVGRFVARYLRGAPRAAVLMSSAENIRAAGLADILEGVAR
jgi:zinc protease